MRSEAIKAVALAALFRFASAVPASGDKETKLNIVATTTHNGVIVDWVTRESQGKIYTPPSRHPVGAKHGAAPLTGGFEHQGPEGTVPIARMNKELPLKLAPPQLSDDAITLPHLHTRDDNYTNQHWYALAETYNLNRGAGAFLSVHDPYLQFQDDFSLMQIAVGYENASQPNGAPPKHQSIEAGWIKYPSYLGKSMLFTFFTTNGYGPLADNTGSYNTIYKGWYQQDRDIYPGMLLTQFSVDGGDQEELQVQYKLHDGCWWLTTLGREIGCYPADLFHGSGVAAGNTLASGSNHVSFYGEVANSGPDMTTTDMGSGHYAGDGYKHAASIRQMKFLDNNLNNNDFDGSSWASTQAGYSVETKFKSGVKGWDSYMYLGGPGSGGKTGA